MGTTKKNTMTPQQRIYNALIIWSLIIIVFTLYTKVAFGQGLSELYHWPESPDNIVKNPSFEERDEGENLLNWKVNVPARWSVVADGCPAESCLRLSEANTSSITPSVTQVLPLAIGDTYTLRIKTRAQNTITDDRGGRAVFSENPTSVTGKGVGDSGWVTTERSFIYNPRINPVMKIESYRGPGGTVDFDDIEVRRQLPPPIESFLLYPNYRGYLWEDEVQVIVVRLTVRPQEVNKSLDEVKVRIVIEPAGDGSSAWPKVGKEFPPPAATFNLRYDIPSDMGPTLKIRFQLVDNKSQVLREYPYYQIRKVSKAEREAMKTYIDTDQVLVLDGKRTFPIGVYDTGGALSAQEWKYEERFKKLSEAPIDLYLNYHWGEGAENTLNAMMNVAGRYGIKYLHTVNLMFEKFPILWAKFPRCEGKTPIEWGEDGYTACRARELGSHPALAGWYVADEQHASVRTQTFRQYKSLRQHDIDGITFHAQTNPGELDWWRDAADVISTDPYPIYQIPEGVLGNFTQVCDWTKRTVTSVYGARPPWTVVQFFKFGSKGHYPTETELRSMSWLAIICGAKGLFYWSLGTGGGLQHLSNVSPGTDPETGLPLPSPREIVWRRLVNVTKEIKSLESALLAPNVPILSTTLHSSLVHIAKNVNEEKYLFVVNNTKGIVENVSFPLTDLATTVEVIGENRTIPVTDRVFVDSFNPYEVHLYKIQ